MSPWLIILFGSLLNQFWFQSHGLGFVRKLGCHTFLPKDFRVLDYVSGSHKFDLSKSCKHWDIFLSHCNNKLNLFFDSRLSYIEAKVTDLLFGIAKKARSITVFQWPCRTLLWTSPLDMYNRWYLLWPVPTETMVLSLPRMVGQKVDPWFLGSWAILFYLNCN